MTPEEHYAEAEALLARAEENYLDDSDDPAPREAYASDEEHAAAIREALDVHEYSIRVATLFASMAAAHATLAGYRPPVRIVNTPATGITCARCGDTDGPFAVETTRYAVCEACVDSIDGGA